MKGADPRPRRTFAASAPLVDMPRRRIGVIARRRPAYEARRELRPCCQRLGPARPEQALRHAFGIAIYVLAFVVGAIVMSFEMLGSRYLNPYFGSGIYTWASLISTVLAALCAGYFIGGWLADRYPSVRVLGLTVLIGSAYLLFLPLFAEPLLVFFLERIDDVRAGSLVASFAIMFFPVTLLGMYSPFGIRLLLQATHSSGTISGTVYGVSTAGSIVGTLGTTFFLIPMIGSRAITITLGVCGVLAGLILMGLARFGRRSAALALAGILLATGYGTARKRRRIDRRARSAPPCSHARTARSLMWRRSTTTSSSTSAGTSFRWPFSLRAGTTPSRRPICAIPTTCR